MEAFASLPVLCRVASPGDAGKGGSREGLRAAKAELNANEERRHRRREEMRAKAAEKREAKKAKKLRERRKRRQQHMSCQAVVGSATVAQLDDLDDGLPYLLEEDSDEEDKRSQASSLLLDIFSDMEDLMFPVPPKGSRPFSESEASTSSRARGHDPAYNSEGYPSEGSDVTCSPMEGPRHR